MTSYDQINVTCHAAQLSIYGGFQANPNDGLPQNTQTVFLLGPISPDYWQTISDAAEFHDTNPDPLDRWSRRVITQLADDLGARPFFPFGGPPYQPFIDWAQRFKRSWTSPSNLLVHDTTGLMVSFRGALALTDRITLPDTGTNPCDSCATQPCRTACPVGAMTSEEYDLPTCKTYLNSDAGQPCMTQGCAVRRACPVSQAYGRRSEQSAFHMRAFNPS